MHVSLIKVTHDCSALTTAALLESVGKRTPVFVRFSLMAADRGASDSTRDLRGIISLSQVPYV